MQGDIAAQDTDGIVNAANTGLRMGAGVAGALREAGGERLNDAAVGKAPVDLGCVAVTDGYGLKTDHVLHAATMPPGGSATARSVRLAARNSLRVADALRLTSLALPALGCGAAGMATEAGGRVIAEELDAFDAVGLADVRLVAYGEDDYETLARVADEL